MVSHNFYQRVFQAYEKASEEECHGACIYDNLRLAQLNRHDNATPRDVARTIQTAKHGIVSILNYL